MTAPSAHESLRGIVLTLFPWLVLSGLHTYVVSRVNDDGTVDLEPPPGLLSPPRLPSVGQWLAAGYEAVPVVGSEVTIVYRDNDRRRPAIVACAPLRRSKPTGLEIDATGTITIGASASVIKLGSHVSTSAADATAQKRVVCYGDTVALPPGGGMIELALGSCSNVRG